MLSCGMQVIKGYASRGKGRWEVELRLRCGVRTDSLASGLATKSANEGGFGSLIRCGGRRRTRRIPNVAERWGVRVVEPHASADPDPTTSSRVGAEGSRAAAESAA